MNIDEFINEMNELRGEYNFCISEDSDLWSAMTGFIFYRNEEVEQGFCHITGVMYNNDGTGLEGDFLGVLNLMKEAVKKEYS